MAFNVLFDQSVHYLVVEGGRQKLFPGKLSRHIGPLAHSGAACASNNKNRLSYPGKAYSWLTMEFGEE